jgi:hypothetical protein
VAHGKRNTKRGTQRFRGPAVDGHPFKVRCPNTPASMRMPHTIPTTTCVRAKPADAARPSPVADSELERDRQHHPWQSTRWALSFNRRTLVEGLIGANRYQRLSVNRGFFRQTGLVATGMLLAITLIGHNLVRLHAWHTVRGRPEPWQVHLGEPVDDRPLDKATRTGADASSNRTDQSRASSHQHDVSASLPGNGHETAKPAPRHTKRRLQRRQPHHEPHNDETPGRI